MEKVSSGFYIYGDCYNQNLMVLNIELADVINLQKMEEAVNKALLIHPNIKVKLVWNNNNFYFEHNDKYFYITKKENIVLISDTNDYLFGVTIKDNEFIVSMSHVLADGCAMSPFIKSCLIYYYSLIGAEDFSDKINQLTKKYSNIEKYVNPYNLPELYNKSLTKEVIRYNNFKFSDMSDSRNQKVATFMLCHDKLMNLSKAASVDKMSMLLAILAENLIEKFEESKDVSAYILMDMRHQLGIRLATHECVAENRINLGSEKGIDLQIRAQKYNKLWAESEPDKRAMEGFIRNSQLVKTFQKERIGYNAKANMYEHLIDMQIKNQDTFSYSMMSFINKNEKLKDYVRSLYVYGINSVMDMLLEIHQVGDYECITVTYCEGGSTFVDNLKNKFDELGLLISNKSMEISDVKINLEYVMQQEN